MSQGSYRQIFKTTSLFGSVQIFSIILGLIKSKIIAVLLGPVGYGINNLFQTPINLISMLSNMGLGFSATRDIASAISKGDHLEFSKIVKILKRWMWITGLLGVFITIVFSPLLSQWSFKDKDHVWTFICLSVVLLLMAFNGGQIAIIQGARKHKDYAKAIALSSLFGLLITVPLYYFWGNSGIAPALIVSIITTTLFSWHYTSKISVSSVALTQSEVLKRGKSMIKLGIMFNLGALVSQLTYYLTILFIRNKSGEAEVGLFSSGWSITNQYVGLIFSAMAVDYFPKLATLQEDNAKMKEAVNEQGEIAVMIVAPMIILYLTFLPIVIKLLLISEFLPILDFTKLLIVGMLIKTASWTMGYVTLAKGDTRIFFVLEVIGNSITLAGSVIGYFWGGLEGIGIGIVSCFLLNYIIISVFIQSKYNIFFSGAFQKIFLLQLLLIIVAFAQAYFISLPWMYVTGSILFFLSAYYSFVGLDKRMGLKKILSLKFKKDK